MEVDEAKADEEEEGKEAEGGRKGKRKKRLSKKSFGDWARNNGRGVQSNLGRSKRNYHFLGPSLI